MSASALPRMTADEFIAWAMEQPESEHYELVAGEIVAMAPERASHVRGKQRIFQRFDAAIGAAGLPCEAFIDGLGVQADETTLYIPDVLVRCGPPLPDGAVTISDPIIVVEILSPSTRGTDTGAKFADYFRIPSVRHYLIVRMETKTVIHHTRDASGSIGTRIVRDGPIALDPPGIVLNDLFSTDAGR